MNQEPLNSEQFMDAAAQWIGLPIAPDHRPGVIENLDALQAVARLVMDFPLPPDVEAAPIFLPAPESLQPGCQP